MRQGKQKDPEWSKRTSGLEATALDLGITG